MFFCFSGHVSISTSPGSASLSLIDFQENMEGSFKCILVLADQESKEFDVSLWLLESCPSYVDYDGKL